MKSKSPKNKSQAKRRRAPGAGKLPKQEAGGGGKKRSSLDAAYEVLKAKGEPMACRAIVYEMIARGLWATNGKTPAATIYSAILREIDNKPGEARFAKIGRGLFTAATPKKS